MSINLLLLVAGGIQGLFLTIVILKKSDSKKRVIPLLALLWVMTIQIFMKVVNKWWIMDEAHLMYQAAYLLPYITIPLLVWYASSSNSGNALPLGLFPWFIPAILAWGQYILDIWISGDFYYDQWWRATVQVVFMGWAMHYALRLAHGDSLAIRFIRVSAVTQAVIIVALTISVEFELANIWVQSLFLSVSLYLYWVSYTVITERGFRLHLKYRKSGLRYSKASDLLETMITTMIAQKLYKNESLTLESFSDAVRAPRNHVSQALNEQLGISFKDWINGYRIEEAAKLLMEARAESKTVAAIAFESGFNSLSRFNEVFKKSKGVTPGQYRMKYAKVV